jgi:hypothetical protein
MAEVKVKVEARCQELATKVHSRDRKIAALQAQLAILREAAAIENESACVDQRR